MSFSTEILITHNFNCLVRNKHDVPSIFPKARRILLLTMIYRDFSIILGAHKHFELGNSNAAEGGSHMQDSTQSTPGRAAPQTKRLTSDKLEGAGGGRPS